MRLFLMVCCALVCSAGIAAANDAAVLVAILDAEYQAKQTATPDLPSSAQEDIGSDESVVVERSRRVLYLTAKWCKYCRQEEPQLAGLKSKGWEVGDSADMQIQVVDVDTASGKELLSTIGVRYQALPAFVLIDNGRVSTTLIGYRDAFAIAELYTGRRMR